MLLEYLNMKMAEKCVSEYKPQSFKYIKNLSNLEKKEFLNSFDYVFCDCDGVIWHTFGEGIPGISTAMNFLRYQGKQVTFVTNNSIIPIEEQIQKFQTCNINVKKEDIIHPAQTICDYLKSLKFDGLIYCLASTSFKNFLRNDGFQLVDTNKNIISESVHVLREAIYTNEPINAVVLDVDFNLTATKLMRAHVHLKNPECLFLAGAADETVSFSGGDIIGSGAFIGVVEKASKRKATILGKPGMELCKILKDRYNLHNRTKRALFIGDSITSDVRFGKLCGFQTLLVLSGGTKASDLEQLQECDEVPDYVAVSLADLNEVQH